MFICYVIHNNIVRSVNHTTPKAMIYEANKVLYWCVAYLPSEASIIEH
jgi:alanine dehydrogenase